MTNPEFKLSPQQQIVVKHFRDLGLVLPIKDDGDVPAPAAVARALAIPRTRVTEVYYDLRRQTPPLLPTPNPLNSRERAANSISEARGGHWVLTKKYAPFMTAKEIFLLLTEQLGEKQMKEKGLNKANISRTMSQHRSRHPQQLRRRSSQERETTKMVRFEDEATVKGRVKFWDDIMNILDEKGIKYPDHRVVWMDIWRRAENVTDGVRLVVERLAQGQRLHAVVQQILETQALASSLSTHLRNNFVADERDEKVFKEFRGTIDRIDSMSLTLAEKEQLFRCLFWENKGGEAYAKFFMVPSEKLRKDLGNLIDEVEQLRLMYGSLWPDEKD